MNVDVVESNADRRAFRELPFRLYDGDRNWVAPIRSQLRKQLDPARSPFFEHGSASFFLARCNRRVIGRICAHIDEGFSAFHAPDATGFWGFFECERDPEAAAALFDAAERWLADRGRTTMLGPASFTLNDECGLLVDGFDVPPMVLMSYNPEWYRELIEGAGFAKAQDLWAYRLDAATAPPDEIVSFARSAEDEGFTFRPFDPRHFEQEMRRFLEVYNEAWERNWGFCPMTEAQIREHAKTLRTFLDPRLVIVCERDGETAGVGLTVPDVNEAIIRLHGRITPAGLIRLLVTARRRRWDACRVVALGVKHAYRRSGVGAHLSMDTLAAARLAGYRWGEMSWILESNDKMNRAIRQMGGTVYKTYRMYARPIPSGTQTPPR